jgi:alkylation response protein AidB-like acyl-CoA dehydrogenase
MTTTTTTTGNAATTSDLSDEHLALQRRARDFVEQVLRPLELTAEAAAGRLPDETVATIKREAIAARLQGGRVPVELGGQGWSMRRAAR